MSVCVCVCMCVCMCVCVCMSVYLYDTTFIFLSINKPLRQDNTSLSVCRLRIYSRELRSRHLSIRFHRRRYAYHHRRDRKYRAS